jgi:hypothetical protein
MASSQPSQMGGNALNQPTPSDVFTVSSHIAALLRALLLHPSTTFVGDMMTDPTTTPPTLYNVTDFVQRTYITYLLPLLPPNATKKCKALANPWAYEDLDWTKETDGEAMAPGKYPRIQGNAKLEEQWRDANGRSVMIGMIINDPKKQAMFGGSFDFGKDVYDAAEKLYKPSETLRPENVVKLATLAGNEGRAD